MAQATSVLSISLPVNLTKAIDELAQITDQNRSELVRAALREYLADCAEDRQRFLEAYKATRHERTISLEDLRKKYQI